MTITRTRLAVVYTGQDCFLILIFFDQFVGLGFSVLFGIVEILLAVFPSFLANSLVSSEKSTKRLIVIWSIISMIAAGICMYEGTVLGYGILRTWWSFVYIIPACVGLYYAGRLKKL